MFKKIKNDLVSNKIQSILDRPFRRFRSHVVFYDEGHRVVFRRETARQHAPARAAAVNRVRTARRRRSCRQSRPQGARFPQVRVVLRNLSQRDTARINSDLGEICVSIYINLQKCNHLNSLPAAASDFTDTFNELFWLPSTIDMADLNGAFDELFWLPATIDFENFSLEMIQLFDEDATVYADLNVSDLAMLFQQLCLDDIDRADGSAGNLFYFT